MENEELQKLITKNGKTFPIDYYSLDVESKSVLILSSKVTLNFANKHGFYLNLSFSSRSTIHTMLGTSKLLITI